MTAFDKTFAFFDNPRGGTDQLDKLKAAGFAGGFGNVIDYEPAAWDAHRASAKAHGLFFGPWGRTGHPPPQGTGFELLKLDKIIEVADRWAAPMIANCEKEIDNTGDDITALIKFRVGARDCALSCEAWPFGNVDWRPVGHLPVLPQIFPQDWGWPQASTTREAVASRAQTILEEWHRRGVKCVFHTYGAYGGWKPEQFPLQAPFSLYTADAIGIQNYGLWKPTSSGFKGCVETTTPPPPKKTVKQYRAEIEALAKEAVALHSLGPHSRIKIIEREAGAEFPDDQWRVELGPEISLLLDQARGDD